MFGYKYVVPISAEFSNKLHHAASMDLEYRTFGIWISKFNVSHHRSFALPDGEKLFLLANEEENITALFLRFA